MPAKAKVSLISRITGQPSSNHVSYDKTDGGVLALRKAKDKAEADERARQLEEALSKEAEKKRKFYDKSNHK